ncbi:MAG: serine O-acetyltransferase [Firmicutes bacterium]|nr:serine O-acetyltransferase [Bacillota bacterium]
MFKQMRADIRAVFDRDPAARTTLEVVLCYPGLHAIWAHRISHYLFQRDFRLMARLVSHLARFFTGIEIHPGATIGPGFFIDHGMGTVIGETAEIGRNVTIYQGVTLGGTGKEKGKRHPTIGDNVVVASGAKILGSFSVGHDSKIGAGSVVLSEVPPHSTVVGIPGRVVYRFGQKMTTCDDVMNPDDLAHNNLPDPVEEMLRCLQQHLNRLDEKVNRMEETQKTGGKV